jgi:hypothetical protein
MSSLPVNTLTTFSCKVRTKWQVSFVFEFFPPWPKVGHSESVQQSWEKSAEVNKERKSNQMNLNLIVTIIKEYRVDLLLEYPRCLRFLWLIIVRFSQWT